MFANPTANWYPSNRDTLSPVCDHCGGAVRHQRWCITRSPLVKYAFEIVADSRKVALYDRLVLHALGVSWATRDVTSPADK